MPQQPRIDLLSWVSYFFLIFDVKYVKLAVVYDVLYSFLDLYTMRGPTCPTFNKLWVSDACQSAACIPLFVIKWSVNVFHWNPHVCVCVCVLVGKQRDEKSILSLGFELLKADGCQVMTAPRTVTSFLSGSLYTVSLTYVAYVIICFIFNSDRLKNSLM